MDTPYLNTAEAAAYLRYPSAESFRAAVRSHGIPYEKRGRLLLFRRDRLDAWIRTHTAAAKRRTPAA